MSTWPIQGAGDVCVAVPGRVVARDPASTRAVVVFGSIRRPIDLTMTPEVGVGDWIIVHSGFAVRRVTVQDAAATQRMLDEMVSGQ